MTDIKQNTTRNMTPMNEDLAVLRKHFPQCITFYCRNRAGADAVLTYYAKQAAIWLQNS
jgi:delta-aminolevulinic acid dehydratase/porphobilinogen synthase